MKRDDKKRDQQRVYNSHEQEPEEQPLTPDSEGERFEEFVEEARISAESIVDTLREPLVVLDNELRVVSANRSFYKTFQVTPEETLGRWLYELGNGQWDIAELRRLLEEVLPRSNPFHDFMVEYDFPNIGRKVMILNARRLHQTRLHPEFILLAIEDVTGRKEKDASLFASEERYRLLAQEVIDYAIFLLDPDGRVATWSEGARRIKQYTAEEIIGEHFRTLYPQEDRERRKPEWELEVVKREGRYEDFGWRRKKDGSLFWADVVITALRDENGRLVGFGKVVKDLTEQKRIAEERERLRELELVEVALSKEQHITEVLQRSLLLTPPEEVFPNLLVASRYQPALDEAHVGGDFLDAFAVEGGRVALVVGDAAGKGLEAAARTAEIKFALRAYLRDDGPVALAQVMGRLNRFLCDFQRLDNRQGGDFVVLALALVTPATGEVQVCLAGAEPPLIVRGGGEAEELSPGGLPLGVMPDETYPVTALSLEHGDIVVMTTDGITEARAPSATGSRFLGYDGFARLAREAKDAPSLVEMGQAILDGANAFSSGSLRDDACLLLAKRQSPRRSTGTGTDTE